MNIDRGGKRRGNHNIESDSGSTIKSPLSKQSSTNFSTERFNKPEISNETCSPNDGSPSITSSKNIVATVFRSNTTYSAIANVIFASIFISTLSPAWAVVTFVPVVLHLGLGVWGIANEHRSIKNQSKVNEENVAMDKPLRSFFGQPGIMRRYQTGVFALQATLSAFQFNFLDSFMFLSGAVGNNAAAIQTNRVAGFDPEPARENKLQALLTSPGPWWVISDTIAAFRLANPTVVFSSAPVAGLFLSGMLISLYSFGSTLKNLNSQLQQSNSDKEKILQCNLSATQLGTFGLASLLVGNTITGFALSLWALASFALARQIKNKA